MNVRQLTIVVWAGSLLLLAMGCSSGRQGGTEAARRDIAKGHLELRVYGEMFGSDAEYAQLLKERLGVRWNRVAYCIVTERQLNEWKAYNKVMTKEIERRFGVGILERLEREVHDDMPKTMPTTQAI